MLNDPYFSTKGDDMSNLRELTKQVLDNLKTLGDYKAMTIFEEHLKTELQKIVVGITASLAMPDAQLARRISLDLLSAINQVLGGNEWQGECLAGCLTEDVVAGLLVAHSSKKLPDAQPVAWPKASESDQDSGWVIDTEFLEAVRKNGDEGDYPMTLEDAEYALTAALKIFPLYTTPQPAIAPKPIRLSDAQIAEDARYSQEDDDISGHMGD